MKATRIAVDTRINTPTLNSSPRSAVFASLVCLRFDCYHNQDGSLRNENGPHCPKAPRAASRCFVVRFLLPAFAALRRVATTALRRVAPSALRRVATTLRRVATTGRRVAATGRRVTTTTGREASRRPAAGDQRGRFFI